MSERRHQTLKNRILLENISCPMIHAGDHEGPTNLTPVDVTSTSAGTETIFAGALMYHACNHRKSTLVASAAGHSNL